MALTALKPSGHDGFEGLLATIFGAVTARPFRLAGSGSQHGKDGSTVGATKGIAFEAKLYTASINKNEVLSKLTEIIAAQPAHDLWILGATIEIKTQILDPLSKTADRNGINLLILDWSPTAPLPELAVACALAPNETAAFLTCYVADQTLVAPVVKALEAVASHANFARSAAALRATLFNPGIGVSVAADANRNWLMDVFIDERAARREFGQPLAPLAQNALPTVERGDLVQQMQDTAFGPPVDSIVVLLGDEGCGKSWIFAQSWLDAKNPPLALIITATDVPDGLASGDERDFLVRQIIHQTGGRVDQQGIARWQSVLEGWEGDTQSSRPNLVVLVDGLNQRPGYAWPQWLDRMAWYLARVGGRLVISVRNGFFFNRVRDSLTTPQHVLRINAWTENELKAILEAEKIDASNLKPRVIALLRNPRVLGIAFDLLREGSIRTFDELSVERLLFEHIRKSARFQQAPEEPLIFTKRLAEHAQEILTRVPTNGTGSWLDFESADLGAGSKHKLTQDLLAVSGSRFFDPVPDDPYFYRLTDDGLDLALGFAILDTIARARRTGADVDETLGVMLEPIAALDRTAEAVFAALMLSSVDGRSGDATTRALIAAFLRLQNIDERDYRPFEAIVRSCPEAAMSALAELSASSRHTEHADWLTAALREARRDPASWDVMSACVGQWLRTYSLDPTIRIFRNDAEAVEQYDAKVAERTQALRQKMDGLSPGEVAFVARAMHRDDQLANGSLARKAFGLLAGMPLAPFAESLVARAFSQAINSDFHAPYNELIHLVRFNPVDWAQTRDSLLKHAAPLFESDASDTGRWALVHILRSTGTIEDSARCDILVEALTRDRPTFANWRLIETYCDTDPCDPDSGQPSTIEDTARKYRALDPTTIRAHLSMSGDDHFLRDAGLGLARFDPETSIAVHRQVLDSVSQTISHLDVHRIFNVREDAPLITADIRERFLALARKKSGPHRGGDESTRDDWLIAQHALLLAFPHMSGDEQLDALVSLPRFGPPLLDLADVLKPASPHALEAALDRCAQVNDDDFRMTILMVARYSGSPLTERSANTLRTLALDEKSAVRALAIGTLAETNDRVFLSSFAEGRWDANALDPSEAHFERWDGARALAKSVSLELVDAMDALDRVAPEHYHMLALSNEGRVGSAIADRVDAALARAVDVDPPPLGPTIEQDSADPRKGFDSPLRSLAEPAENLGPEEFFKRMSENENDFDDRQQRGWAAFEAFEGSLTRLSAGQILQDTPIATLDACIAQRPDLARAWARTCIGLSDHRIRNIYNFGLRLAEALSHREPELSAALFEHLRSHRGFLRIVSGPASLGLESLSVWRAADHSAIGSLRRARLDCALTDNEIAQEVLAATVGSKDAFLDLYVREMLDTDRPVDVARALMVCGFSLSTDSRDGIIAAHSGLPGPIGEAARRARYAYDRNVWARHWYDRMRDADTPEEFWRFAVLFLKLVDGRYQHWNVPQPGIGSPMERFAPGLWHGIKRRIKSWQDKRAKTLFGEKAPNAELIANVMRCTSEFADGSTLV